MINQQEYAKDQASKYLAGITLLVLMLTQISSLWTKFIIGAAYNYDGVHLDEPKYDIKAAISISYTQYSEITGLYYSLTYGMAALFAGRISDSYSRKILITLMCLMWNLTSFGNALANSFGMLAVMRMSFGLFSAFSSPICYSLIADYFPPQNRTIANACFTASSFLGIAFANLSNLLIDVLGWRVTYVIVGIYGGFVLALVILILREPERGRYDASKNEKKEEPQHSSITPNAHEIGQTMEFDPMMEEDSEFLNLSFEEQAKKLNEKPDEQPN